MVKAQRTPLDLMDDIYSLAHWLTGFICNNPYGLYQCDSSY